ncbi:hypothetical protein TCON_0985 [Astathelohania contejeani]|uniref:Uncharacterized protein n=1 Tax=Astathelohania contejeani TaxID=164912 RepID=A0ABQ7I058_9MICR|nr:hypothetical protein TCON_0985 [Thelohania contejeani]
MVYIKDMKFPNGSLIEICTFPGMEIHKLMAEISTQVETSFFIDTCGNMAAMGIKCHRVFDIKHLFEYVAELKKHSNFYLFIDTITFLIDISNQIDENKYTPQKFYNELWSLIYKNGATVIVSNHYKMNKINGKAIVKPRMGILWYRIISYRIFMEWKGEEIIFRLDEFKGAE